MRADNHHFCLHIVDDDDLRYVDVYDHDLRGLDIYDHDHHATHQRLNDNDEHAFLDLIVAAVVHDQPALVLDVIANDIDFLRALDLRRDADFLASEDHSHHHDLAT